LLFETSCPEEAPQTPFPLNQVKDFFSFQKPFYKQTQKYYAFAFSVTIEISVDRGNDVFNF
jgi:hypothetical protein